MSQTEQTGDDDQPEDAADPRAPELDPVVLVGVAGRQMAPGALDDARHDRRAGQPALRIVGDPLEDAARLGLVGAILGHRRDRQHHLVAGDGIATGPARP